jgi:hypothetical protein
MRELSLRALLLQSVEAPIDVPEVLEKARGLTKVGVGLDEHVVPAADGSRDERHGRSGA